MGYIKYKLTGALLVAFLFLSVCNGGDGSGYWKSCRDYRYIYPQGGEAIRSVRDLLSVCRNTFVTYNSIATCCFNYLYIFSELEIF